MIDSSRCIILVCVLVIGAAVLATDAQAPPSGDTPTSQPAKTGTGADQPATTPPTGGTPAAPTQEEVIEAFERDRPAGAPIPPVEAVGSETPDDTKARKPRARYPDGYVLIDRPGRISREGQWWVFSFESDSPSFEEPPVRLLPNRMLEHAVYEVEGSPHAVFVISGEVTDYEGQNYLLLRKLLRRRAMDNLSR